MWYIRESAMEEEQVQQEELKQPSEIQKEETLMQSFRSSILPVNPEDSVLKKFAKRTIFYAFASFLLLITIAIGSVFIFFL